MLVFEENLSEQSRVLSPLRYPCTASYYYRNYATLFSEQREKQKLKEGTF